MDMKIGQNVILADIYWYEDPYNRNYNYWVRAKIVDICDDNIRVMTDDGSTEWFIPDPEKGSSKIRYFAPSGEIFFSEDRIGIFTDIDDFIATYKKDIALDEQQKRIKDIALEIQQLEFPSYIKSSIDCAKYKESFYTLQNVLNELRQI